MNRKQRTFLISPTGIWAFFVGVAFSCGGCLGAVTLIVKKAGIIYVASEVLIFTVGLYLVASYMQKYRHAKK